MSYTALVALEYLKKSLNSKFSIKNLRHEYLMNNIRVYEDLLEKINNGEFRNQKIKKWGGNYGLNIIWTSINIWI